MRNLKKLILASAAISALVITDSSLAISPDGGKGSSHSSSAPSSRPLSHTTNSSTNSRGLPILENPSVDDVKKALGIGQPKTKDLAALKEAGFGSFIEFETDSATVIPSGGLDIILSALVDLEPDASVEIVGHTDNQGGEAHNMELSRRRAESVRRWLEQNGVRTGAIRTRGEGFHQPVDTNSTAEGRRKNRRVEFSRIYE